MDAPELPGPLDDIVVADFSRVVSGPSCAKALADLGARVIKVEPPEGDLTRYAHPQVGGIPAYFAQQNAGKECVAIDCKDARGQAIARRLAASADVVVENFRPGVAARLGIGYADIAAERPDVVYCSISGYGQDGPMAQRRAYAPVVHAEMGLMELTARRRGEEPKNEIVVWGDLFTGMEAALAVVAAIRHRDRSGVGAHLDVSMAESMLHATQYTSEEIVGPDTEHNTVFNAQHAPVVTLGDGTPVMVPGDPVANFRNWVGAMGKPELLDDPRLAERPTRAEHRDVVMAEIEGWAATFTDFDAFETAVSAARLAVGKIRPLADAVSQPWAVERGIVVEVNDPPIPVPRGPVRSTTFSDHVRGPAAFLGQHNRAVLAERCGLSPTDLDELTTAGVLVEARH